MDKYIGFDIDSKKTVACIVQKGERDRYTTFKTDIGQMKSFLQQPSRLHVRFIAQLDRQHYR
jgi:hypothetical protein